MGEKFKTPSPQEIKSLFTRIASRYDLLNFLMSFGLDRLWRNRAASEVRPEDRALLDVGTGSGELLRAFLRRGALERAVGLDPCEALLGRARRSLAGQANVRFIQADIFEASLEGELFDIVSSSFVLRSLLPRLEEFFKRAFELLRPSGRFIALELTRPQSRFLRPFFLGYLKCWVPCVGALVAGDPSAYRFLSDSVLDFPDGETVAGMLKKAGFQKVRAEALSAGLVTLFVGEK